MLLLQLVQLRMMELLQYQLKIIIIMTTTQKYLPRLLLVCEKLNSMEKKLANTMR